MMNLSLSRRVKITYLITFILLSIVSTIMIYAASKSVEDHIFETQLAQQVNQYTRSLATGEDFKLPDSITVFSNKQDIPRFIAKYINQTIPGIYELSHPDEFDYHYAIKKNLNGETLFFIYDVNTIEISEGMERIIIDFVLLFFLILLTVFLIVFNKIITKALKPMYSLIKQVEKQAKKPDQSVHYTFKNDDELGLLGKTIKDYSHQIHNHIQKEREFSSFVSHELRTPVTVIKGALDVLKLKPDSDKTEKLVNRVARATQTMEDTIETLLILSKDLHNLDLKKTDLFTLLQNVLANFEGKLQTYNKETIISGELISTEQVSESGAEIVLSNLLLNAIQHSCHHQITIYLSDNTIVVSNRIQNKNEEPITQTPASLHEQGYGLGKLIVNRICKKNGWLIKETVGNEEYSVQVTFKQND